jgi:hypothetical protein
VGEFKKYDHTTQITTLPGGAKRDMHSIKDDKKFINKRNQGFFMKMSRDYNSRMSDIIGSQVNKSLISLFNI